MTHFFPFLSIQGFFFQSNTCYSVFDVIEHHNPLSSPCRFSFQSNAFMFIFSESAGGIFQQPIIIAAMAAGVIVLLLVLAISVYCCRKSRRKTTGFEGKRCSILSVDFPCLTGGVSKVFFVFSPK